MVEKEKEKETNNVIHGWQKFSQMSSSIHDSLCFVRVFLRFALGTTCIRRRIKEIGNRFVFDRRWETEYGKLD